MKNFLYPSTFKIVLTLVLSIVYFPFLWIILIILEKYFPSSADRMGAELSGAPGSLLVFFQTIFWVLLYLFVCIIDYYHTKLKKSDSKNNIK